MKTWLRIAGAIDALNRAVAGIVRWAGAGMVGIWALASLAWAGPSYLLRRDPAPVWESLIWVREHFDPKPHATGLA